MRCSCNYERKNELEENKKKNTGLIVGIIVGVIVLLAVSAGVIFAIIMNSPKVRLAKGTANMVKEMAEYASPAAEQIAFTEISNNIRNSQYASNMDFTFTLPENEDIDNINLSIQSNVDRSNELASIDFSIGAYHLSLVEGNMTISDNEMYITLPKLVKDTYSLRLDTIGADYNNSEWAKELGLEVDKNASYDFFADNEDNHDWDDFAKELETDMQTLKESVTIAKADDKIAFERDGKIINCRGVRITISKDAMNTFLSCFQEEFKKSKVYQDEVARLIDEYATAYLDQSDIEAMVDGYMDDIFGIRCKNDVVFNIYMDRKGRIVRIATKEAQDFNSSDVKSVDFCIDFKGVQRALDVIDGTITVAMQDDTYQISVTREADVSDTTLDEDISITCKGDTSHEMISAYFKNKWDLENLEFDGAFGIDTGEHTIDITADGSFTDYVKGESYTLDIGTASMVIDDKALLRVAGTVDQKPCTESIDVPAQSKYLFDMTTSEIYALVYEIVTSMQADAFY